MKSNSHLSRSAALMELTARAVHNTRDGVVGFADRVAEHYLANVPEQQRNARLKPVVGNIDQVTAAQRANRQTVDRYIKGEVRSFPADLEEAWVNALQQPFQDEALQMLAGRYGLLAAKVRTPREALESLQDATHAFSSFLGGMAPIVADGVIDARDQAYLKPALQELSDLQAALASIQTQLTNALPDQQANGKVVSLRSAG